MLTPILRRSKTTLLFTVLITTLLTTSCTRREGDSGAVGPVGEVSVFTNEPRDGEVVTTFLDIFNYDLDMIGPESSYRIDLVKFDQFKVHRYVKNQVFLVNMGIDDDLARTLPSFLNANGKAKLRQGKPFRHLVRDQFARGQVTLFLVGRTSNDLKTLLADTSPELQRRSFEAAVVGGLSETMFSLGEDKQLPISVAQDFGWTVRLPNGFYGAKDADGRFVKFNADDPGRLLLVHWVEEVVPLELASWAPIMDRILKSYNDQDYVDMSALKTYVTNFQGQRALKWEGIWQNDKYTIGGPFRAYAFERDGRSYLLIGQVFNPGSKKLPTIRQMDAIMNTFRAVG
ncbi:MAG: DUF4837 family protein [Candidatus Eisenbacteria bacterium]|uniref:DUF4837 family protein n=1 Tax=Eiseniibacteriota bacterium TaxID=2212470 RepID=A0A7Y2H1S3_UNCEI|nr:DUF4837 family protein [Candidatus Eisenbacteria bacterium]